MTSITKTRVVSICKQRGFIIPLSALLIFAIIIYTLVVMSYAANATRKAELYNNVLDALNAAVNASPGLARTVGGAPFPAEMDIFQAACNTLRSTMFFGVGAANFPCTPATFIPTAGTPPGRTVQYGSIGSPLATDDGKLRCEQVQFTYTQSDPNQVGSRQRFCIDITCDKRAGFIPQSLVSQVGASSCIAAGQTVTYVGLDLSDNWSNTYRDCIRSDGTNCLPQNDPLSVDNVYVDKHPPGMVVMGNPNYFSSASAPASSNFYTDPIGARQYTPQTMINQLRDMQVPGMSSYLQVNTGLLQNEIDLPFQTSEFDFNESTPQSNIAGPTGAPLRADSNLTNQSLTRFLNSLPNVLNPHSRDLGLIGVAKADHSIFHHYVPQLEVFQPHGIESTMMRWLYQHKPATPLLDLSPTPMTSTWSEFPLLQTRGGFVTEHAQSMSCFNPFWMTGKSVAQQLLYELANRQQRAGLSLISQVVIPGAPVLPEPLVVAMGIDPVTTPLAGPDPSTQPGIYQSRDFVLEQFGDSTALSNDQVNYQNALLMGHIKDVCWSNITHQYAAGGARRLRALQNPYNSATTIEPPRWPNYQQGWGGESHSTCPNPIMPQMGNGSYYPIIPGQPNKTALFNHPNGLCYDTIDNLVTGLDYCTPNFFTHALNSLGNPLQMMCMWRSDNSKASLSGSGSCNAGTGFLRTGGTVDGTSPYQSNKGPIATPNFIWDVDIDNSYRWCPNNPPAGYGPPTLPVAIQSLSSGNFAFRSNGFSAFYNPADPNNSAPLNPGSLFSGLEFPRRTNGPERAAPAALLGMLRSLRNPELVGPFDSGALVLILNGLPEVSIYRTLDDSGATQSTLSIPPPTSSELPDYDTGLVNYNGQIVDLNATFESLHLIHSAVAQGIRVSVILVQSDLSDPRVDILRAGLRPPNIAASAVTPYNSFCLPTSLAGSSIGNMPVVSQTCNPTNDPPAYGITLIDLVKQPFPQQSYSQFNQAALDELGTVAIYNLAKYRLSK